MTDAPSLFDAPSKRDALPTSAAQGRAIRERVAEKLYRVLRCYYECPASMTSDECGISLGMEPLSARPRVCQVYKAGWLEPTGARRRTEGGGIGAALRISNKGATVYQAARQEADPVAAIERMYRAVLAARMGAA